jgi:cytochrome P450
VIYSPFFHRDNERLPYADRFAPELWTGTDRQQTWPLIPFSEGPAVCPGRNLMLLLASTMIAAILDRGRVRLIDGRRLATDRLPGTLNHFRLRFEILPRA